MRINKGLLVFAAVMLVAAVTGCGIIRKTEAVKNLAVAEVNGYVITREEFDKSFDLYKAGYESQYGLISGIPIWTARDLLTM